MLRRAFPALLAAAAAVAPPARAESFASSASSAGSASSGSFSDSLHGSSNSSSRDDKKAEWDLRILDVAVVPGRTGFARLTLQEDDAAEPIALDLPQAIVSKEGLVAGGLVHARRQVYGVEFAQGDPRAAFFLVLADDWARDLAARPVSF